MRTLRRFFRHWQNALGLFIVIIYIALAIAAPRLAPPDTRMIPSNRFNLQGFNKFTPVAPSQEVPFGTIPVNLQFHTNIFNVVIWGARSALNFGLIVAVSTALLGVIIGAVSAYSASWLNFLLMRITDAMLAFPVVVGVVLFQTLLRIQISNAFNNDQVALSMYSAGMLNIQEKLSPLTLILMKLNPLMVALIVLSWMPYARITNTMIINLREFDFVEASRALGASRLRIIFRHLIPNAITPAVVLAARDIGYVVMLQASLTFIGLGGGSDWGNLLAQAQRWIIGPGGNILVRWWVFFPATLALVLFGIGWNLVGDGLNDMLNPQTY